MPPPKSNKNSHSKTRRTSPSPNRGPNNRPGRGPAGTGSVRRSSVKGKAGKKNSTKDEEEYPCLRLNNGVEMPIVALGCWNLKQAWSGSGMSNVPRASFINGEFEISVSGFQFQDKVLKSELVFQNASEPIIQFISIRLDLEHSAHANHLLFLNVSYLCIV